MPGIKVDKGTKPLPFCPGEVITEGLDGLRERLIEYRGLGAKFAKWRAVIDIGEGIPSYACIRANAHALARYAALCQEQEIVPIVEPEVLMDGDHDHRTLLQGHRVGAEDRLRGALLPARRARRHGAQAQHGGAGQEAEAAASVEEVADKTVRVLKACVPVAVPGIAFLSGGQSDEEATAHLDAINRIGGLPWKVTFSYGRALQAAPQKAWSGKSENVAAAQRAFCTARDERARGARRMEVRPGKEGRLRVRLPRAGCSARTRIARRSGDRSNGPRVASLLRPGWLIALALAAVCADSPARAEPYPTRNVTIIVSLAPGTGMDTLVRLYGEKLAQRIGQPVVIDNRPGGAGVVAGEAISKGAADGYTLAVATSAIMAIRPTLFKKFPFDPLADFVPISLYVKSPFVLVCDPALPVRSFAELVGMPRRGRARSPIRRPASAARRTSPSSCSSSSSASRRRTCPTATARSRSPTSRPATCRWRSWRRARRSPLIRDGKLRALAVTSTTRFATLPDVPTLAEALGEPNFEMVSWHVILAKAGTPQAIVDKLHAELGGILAADEMRQKISAIGLIPYPSPPIEGIRAYIRSGARNGRRWCASSASKARSKRL